MVALRKTVAANEAVGDDDITLELTPDTIPTEANGDNELFEAVEWLKKAGVVSAERPPFSKFFDELVASNDGSNDP